MTALHGVANPLLLEASPSPGLPGPCLFWVINKQPVNKDSLGGLRKRQRGRLFSLVLWNSV